MTRYDYILNLNLGPERLKNQYHSSKKKGKKIETERKS